MNAEYRKHVREVFLSSISLSDSLHVSESDIVNISLNGVGIERVPEGLIKKIKTNPYVGSFSKGKENIKLNLRPVWYKKDKELSYYTVGFEILKATSNWSSLLKHPIGVSNTTDVWGHGDKYFDRVR